MTRTEYLDKLDANLSGRASDLQTHYQDMSAGYSPLRLASPGECVGFADCPCKRCRGLRLAHTEAHPDHGHIQDRSYCGACKTAARR